MAQRFIPTDVTFSLEVFPPRTSGGEDHLLKVLDAYVSLRPAAITVTFGATGADESFGTLKRIVSQIQKRTETPVAAHMTCAGRTTAEVDRYIDELTQAGVTQIVALRGDIMGQNAPYHPHADGYQTTYAFIESIKKRHPSVKIYVAGYPERHPESPSEAFDLDHLKHKVDAGADAVLTQFFFDPEVYLHWRDKVEKRGITVPLVPGLMPIINFAKTIDVAKRCNANIPDFLNTMFDGVEADSVDHKLLAMNVLSHQITRLVEHGVTHFHFYTMNETLLTRHLCTWLRAGF